MTPKTLSILIATLLAGQAVPSLADDGQWYLAPSLGYIRADDSLHADDGATLGLAVGKMVSENWNIELGARAANLDRGLSGNGALSSVGVDGLYFFGRDRAFSPYALMGLGVLNSKLPGDTDYGLSASLGLGFLKEIGNDMALRAEALYRVSETSLPGASPRIEDWLLNLGLHIPIGPKPVSRPAPSALVTVDTQPVAPMMAAASAPASQASEPKQVAPIASASETVHAPAASSQTMTTAATTTPTPETAPASTAPAAVTPSMTAAATEAPAAQPTPAAAQAPSAPPAQVSAATPSAAPAAPVAVPDAAPADSDGDGVVDGQDKCPGTPPGRKVNAEGCEVDSDGDGVVDALDNCPSTPAGRAVNALGCEMDSDGDGVVDALDKCPGTPAGHKVDTDGCEPDKDGDGVIDALDQCPNTPAGRVVNAIGCEIDSDGDGIVDALDKCPGTPAGRKVDAQGCELDSDGDGVVDALDQCPDTPKGDKVDDKGCTNAVVLKGVNFDSDSAKLRPESQQVLDTTAEVLKRYPHIDIEVAGHTDSTYTDTYNQKLSEDRAKSVCDYFIQKGIEAQRLRAKGYGETKPAADNKTAAGREANRRVELRIEDKQ